MGNRVFVTMKDPQKSQSFYMHWNGGLDTWLPLAQVFFGYGVKDISRAAQFIEKMDLRIEPENINPDDVEENGHYFIDLEKKTFIRKYRSLGYEGDVLVEPIFDLKDRFESFLLNIKEEYRSQVRESYWNGIQQSAAKFFEGAQNINDEELLMLFQGAASLKRLHSESGGLEQHRLFAEQQLEKYRAEILRRMKIDRPDKNE